MSFLLIVGKVVPFLEYSVAHVSALTMLAISFERLLAIVFPLKAQYLISRNKSAVIIGFIWIISIFTSIPFVFITKYKFTEHRVAGGLVPTCISTFDEPLSRAYLHGVVTLFFTLPFFILLFVYAIISYHLIRDSYSGLGL